MGVKFIGYQYTDHRWNNRSCLCLVKSVVSFKITCHDEIYGLNF